MAVSPTGFQKLYVYVSSLPWPFWAVSGTYFLCNVVVAIFAEPGASLAQGGDAGSYWDPAIAFLKYGDFVQLDNPAEPDLYRTPLYPLMISALIFLFGESPGVVISVQLILLFGVGVLFRSIVSDWLSGWEDVGMALVILNPNLLGTAHLIQSETLYLCFISIGFWSLLRIVRKDFRWQNTFTIGIALALACLVKPTSQFLVIVLPIFLPIIALLAGAPSSFWRLFVQGISATLMAIAIMAPWAMKLSAAGNGYSLSEHEIKYRFLWDQVVMLEANMHGLSYHEAEIRITAPGSYHAKVIAAQGEDWNTLSSVEKFAVLERHGYDAILSYPVEVLAKATARSFIQFMFSGGAGNLHNILGIDTARLNRVWFKTSQQDVPAMLFTFFGEAPMAALGLSFLALCFAFLTRCIGFIGIFAMWRRGNYALMFTLLGLIGYFVAVHLFHGNSRYRIPVEPAMILFFLYGLQSVWGIFCDWRRNRLMDKG